MWQFKSKLRLAGMLALWLGILTSARGGLITPNGNPTGATVAESKLEKYGTASLGPPQAGYLSGYAKAADIPWLVAALDKQGFTKANNWNFTTAALNGGNITLGTYLAWADNRPEVSIGTGADKITAPADVLAKAGGANIALSYQPKQNPPAGPPDPSGNSVHWLQVIRTNDPSDFGRANGVSPATDPGFFYYIDDGYNGAVPGDPYYDSGYLANHVNFIDRPARAFRPGAIWNAEVFVVNDVVNAGVHNVTIYDGVYWGFQTTFSTTAPVPEPSAFLLVIVAGPGLATYYRRRRKSAAAMTDEGEAGEPVTPSTPAPARTG